MQDDKLDLIYLRLSKEDGDAETGDEKESCSISSQRRCIWQHIHTHPDLEGNYEELVDDGYSGTNFERPGITRLLKLVQAGLVHTVIVRDLSRFARNYLEAGHFLEFVFPAFNVRFISINDHFDSAELGETTGGFQLAIHNLVNQWYSSDISRKIKSAVDMKKLKGEFVYGTAPYGYKKGTSKNTIVPDEQVADIVRQIFQWAAEGVSVTQIARQLNEATVQSPSEYLKEVRGKYQTRPFWTFDSIRNILLNRIYTGDTVPFKSHVVRVGSNRVKMIPEEEQLVIPDTHEAIVSREQYYQARAVIKSNKKSKPAIPSSPLATYLVCGHCGNRLQKGRHTNRNFKCATARYLPESPCANVLANEAQIKEILLHAIQSQCALLNVKLQEKRQARVSLQSQSSLLQKELEGYNRQIGCYQAASMKWYEDYVSGRITKDEFVKYKSAEKQKEESVKAKALFVQEKLSALPKQQISLEDDAIDLSVVSRYNNITALTPELLKEMVKKLTVFPDGEIEITWNFRDELLGAISSQPHAS